LSEDRKNTDGTMQNTAQFVLTDEQSQNIGKIMVKRMETFNPHRRRIRTEIMANISYLVGEQNIRLVGDAILPLNKERVVESVANVILPAVQKDIAVATGTAPVFDVVPAGSDADDKATAIAGTKILKYLGRRIGGGFKRADAVLWYDIAGIGWRKVYWDPNFSVLGVNPAPVNEDGSANPSHIAEIPVGEAIMEGEVQVDSVPANHLIYDFRQTDPTKHNWMIQGKRVNANWVVDRFGTEVYSKLKTQFSTGRQNGEDSFEARIWSRFGNTYFSGGNTNQTVTPKQPESHQVLLESDKNIDYYEYWEKPTKTMPTGVFAVMLGTQVVAHSPYPIEQYPHGELPFVPVAPLSIIDAMNGAISRISQARPLQREYNELRSQAKENIDVMGNAIIMAPRQAKLRYKTLDNHAGNIIEYDGPVGKPTREPGIPMNSQVFAYIADTKRAIDGIFAFHEPSQGVAPKGIESGKALAQLETADIKHLGPIVAAFEEADERVAYQALSLALTNYPNGKMLNVVGTDYEWTIFELDKKQLQGKFNVIVRRGSSLPLDKEKEKAQTFQIWQSGLLGDPNDPELRTWVMEQMHLGNNDMLLQKHSKQKNFAMKEFVSATENLKDINIPEGLSSEETAKLIEGYLFIPHINAFDDHMIHIMVHNNYMIDNFWKFRSSGNPLHLELLNRFNMHIIEHQQLVQQAQQAAFVKELEAQMMIKGTTERQLVLKKMNFEAKKPETKGK